LNSDEKLNPATVNASVKKALSQVLKEISESEDFFSRLTMGENLLDYKKRTVIMKSENNNVYTVYHPRGNKIYFEFKNNDVLPKGISSIKKIYGKKIYFVVAEKNLFKHVKEFFEKQGLSCKILSIQKAVANYTLKSKPGNS